MKVKRISVTNRNERVTIFEFDFWNKKMVEVLWVRTLRPAEIYAWFAELERADGSMTIVKGEVSLLR